MQCLRLQGAHLATILVLLETTMLPCQAAPPLAALRACVKLIETVLGASPTVSCWLSYAWILSLLTPIDSHHNHMTQRSILLQHNVLAAWSFSESSHMTMVALNGAGRWLPLAVPYE